MHAMAKVYCGTLFLITLCCPAWALIEEKGPLYVQPEQIHLSLGGSYYHIQMVLMVVTCRSQPLSYGGHLDHHEPNRQLYRLVWHWFDGPGGIRHTEQVRRWRAKTARNVYSSRATKWTTT